MKTRLIATLNELFLISCMPSPLSLTASLDKRFHRFAAPGFPELAQVKLTVYVDDVHVLS